MIYARETEPIFCIIELKKMMVPRSSKVIYLVYVNYIYNCVKVKVAQLCLTLCDPMDYTVHGILQARILEWLLQGIFPTPGSNPGLPCCRQILYQLSHKGSPQQVVGEA